MRLKTLDGKLIVISGASRSGKTAYTARQVRTARRVVAYDPEAQFCELPGFRKISGRKALLQAIQTPGNMKLAFVPSANLKADFDFFCACVMYAGRYIGPLECIAEELADVTTPSKAPGHWGILIRRGLKRGITIYAISQRWAEADKTALGNASFYVLFMQSTADDAAYMAKKTRVPLEDIEALKPLEHIIYTRANREITKNKLRF